MAANGAFLNVLKPTGMTSHDVVDFLRRQWNRQQPVGLPHADKKVKVGHLGTLDPNAAGVLPLALGSATRLISHLPAAQKAYIAEITFGLTSDTLDLDGQVVESGEVPGNVAALVDALLPQYRGTVMQVPPRVSALRRDGKRGYDRARQGEDFEFEARPAHYEEVRLLVGRGSVFRLRIACGPGTYVRALARDLGHAVGCGAVLSGLVRTQSGPFKLEDSVTLEEIRQGAWPILPWHWPFPRLLPGEPLPIDATVVIPDAEGRGTLARFAPGQAPQRILSEAL